MKIQQPGFLLWVENYEKCVAFYSEVLGLPIRMQKGDYLTNFRFGDGYIILEKGTPPPEEVRKKEMTPFIIRLNVADVDVAAEGLRAKGVEIKRESYDWGEIGSFRDPDGNLIQLCKFK
jgi:lactoylglutathione lyase